MEQFGCTEKQLYEEFSWRKVQQISEYNKAKNQVAKEEEQKAKARSNVRINR